jgi:hypothetical protein
MQHLSIRFLIGLSKASDDADGIRFDSRTSFPHDWTAETAYDGRAQAALAILARHYPALTAIRGTGYWQGAPEPNLVVESIVDPESDFWTDCDVVGFAQFVAGDVARALDQESVALVVAPVRFSLEGQHGTAG